MYPVYRIKGRLRSERWRKTGSFCQKTPVLPLHPLQSEPPEQNRAEYLILCGRLAAKKQQYETAAEYLRQAEALGPLPKLYERELCQTMELASRELQDYKSAYEYAARQLKL